MRNLDRTGLWAALAAVPLLLGGPGAALSGDALPWQQAANSNDAYRPAGGSDAYGGYGNGGGSGDAYRPDGGAGSSDAYQPPSDGPQGDSYTNSRRDSFSDPPPQGGSAYGEPYAPPGPNSQPYERSYSAAPPAGEQGPSYYEQGEIVKAGHNFFGSISQGLANAVEYAFKSQGRPNGYILGEDAGGALVLGLRYGEGTLYTKDAGNHKVFWQGPSVGYDAGAEGSKTMVLVYNLRDPSEIYERFGGVQGSAYLIGGVSVQFQKLNDVTLAVIRSGVGVRLGANIGYLKYTRAPTWNPL